MPTAAAKAKAIELYSDKRWRLNNLYHVQDEKGRNVPFRLNWMQSQLITEMHYLNCILKARQLGCTTFIQVFMLDECIFNSNITAGTIAHTLNDAQDIFSKKVKFPYDQLPEGLKNHRPAVEDSARKLSFPNDSSLVVGTSLRSGTFQYLHVSEYGKLGARYPEKAREVRTGALNTVHKGQYIWVESTAEGQEGEFYDLTQRAQDTQRAGSALTALDFKFFFFPWWRHPNYVLPAEDVMLTAEDERYFNGLEMQGIHLTPDQKAWYVKKAAQQLDDMKREFPSTPEEAFEASIEGAYYAKQMAKAEADGRICDLPVEEGVAVETWWDLGMNDLMTILWVQRVGPWVHVIDSYSSSGEGLAHYAAVLQEKQRERDLVYGEHVWPHDGNVRILDEKGRPRKEVMRDLGYQVEIVERGNVGQGIQASREILAKTRFDRSRCMGDAAKKTRKIVEGMKSYRREWDEDNAVFKNRPFHNWASHWADAFRTGSMYDDDSGFEGGETPIPAGSYV